MYVYLLFFSPLSHELFDTSPCLDGNFHLPQKNHPKTLLRTTEIIPKNSKQKEKQNTSQKVALCSEDIPLTDRRTRTSPHAAFKLMAFQSNPAGRLHSQESLVAGQVAHRRTVEASRPKRISSSYFLFPSFICMKPH